MGLEGQVRALSAASNALSENAFTAEMIAPACDPGTGGPGCFVAREFELSQVESGTVLHLSAQGLYRAFLNGVRVGDDLLTPGWTCYDDRIAYQSYDVSALLKPGENRLEIWLGDGWYRSRLMWALNPIPNTWGTRTGAFAELVAVARADANLTALPEGMDPALAAGLGCRVTTAWHALTGRAALRPGEWLAVFGGGGVGLSAMMLGRALGARVVVVDVVTVRLASSIPRAILCPVAVGTAENVYRPGSPTAPPSGIICE